MMAFVILPSEFVTKEVSDGGDFHCLLHFFTAESWAMDLLENVEKGESSSTYQSFSDLFVL